MKKNTVYVFRDDQTMTGTLLICWTCMGTRVQSGEPIKDMIRLSGLIRCQDCGHQILDPEEQK